MKAQAGNTGKGKGGRKFSELPARITAAGKKKQPVGNLTYTGPRSAPSTAKKAVAKKKGR